MDYRLDYSQQMVPVGMSDAQAADQTMHMSPMDLFDSIFWGEFHPPPIPFPPTPNSSLNVIVLTDDHRIPHHGARSDGGL